MRLQKDQVIKGKFGEYEVVKQLVKADYSEIWIVRNRGQRFVAKNVLLQLHQEVANREINFINQIKKKRDLFRLPESSCNLVNLIDVCEVDAPADCNYVSHTMLILEELGFSLLDWYEKMPTDIPLLVAKRIMMETLKGLAFLHDCCKIIHTDIKPENILLVRNESDIYKLKVKIIDFGTAKSFTDDRLLRYELIQTRNYRAPEIILENSYNEKIDIWSIACIFYELLRKKVLFQGSTVHCGNHIQEIQAFLVSMNSMQSGGEGKQRLANSCSAPLDFHKGGSILQFMLKFRPDERPSARACFERFASE